MSDFLDDVIEANRNITALECENARLTDAKADLTTEVENLRKQNVEQIEAHQSEKEALEAQIASLTADNTKVKDINKSIAAQRDDFQTKLSALQVEHTKLRNESKMPTEKPKLKLNPTLEQGYSPTQELAQAKNRVKYLEKELSDANELFTNLQQELNECKSERDELQASLDSMPRKKKRVEEEKLLKAVQRRQKTLEAQVKRYRGERDDAIALAESLEEELKIRPDSEVNDQLHEALDDMRVQWNIAVRAATAYQHDIELANSIIADLKLELAQAKSEG